MTDDPPPRRCRYPDLYPYACPAGCYCGRPVATVYLPPHPDDPPIRGAAVIEFARPFVLQRDTDITGVSGTGTVADGVLWPDGSVALRWRGRRPSSVFWNDLDDALSVHGHDGATHIVWSNALHVAPITSDGYDARHDDAPPTGDDAPTTAVDESGGPRCEADPCPLHAARPTPGAAARCTATITGAGLVDLFRTIRCTKGAGHYDPAIEPQDTGTFSSGGWHANGERAWCDLAQGATPHADGPTTAVTEQPTPVSVAVAAELRSIADAIVADAETYPGAGANWHNGVDHAVQAMRARADWMDHCDDQPPTPAADRLRARYETALTREHYRRARLRIVASPEEHCAAMADVIMTVRDAEMDQLRAEREELRRQAAAATPTIERLKSELRAAGIAGH